MKALVTAALLALTATATQAAIAVSNIYLPSSNGSWGVHPGQFIAMSFTVGNTAPQWNLESADLLLGTFGGVSNLATVELHGDSGGNVGGLIVGMGSTVVPVGIASYQFTPSAPVTLAAGATYWITTSSADVPSALGWIYANPLSNSESGQPGWSIGDSLGYSTNQGASWNQLSGFNLTLFTINASAVPEPTTAVLALSMLGLLVPRRRK